MDLVTKLGEINIIIELIKMFFISISTFIVASKIINNNIYLNYKLSIVTMLIFITSILCSIIKFRLGFFYSIICMILLMGIIFSKYTKRDILYSLILITISLSIIYIIFYISIIISFIPSIVINIQNNYIGLMVILLIDGIILFFFLRTRKIKRGIIFLQNKLQDEYFNIMVFNISIAILFLTMLLTNYDGIIIDRIFEVLVILGIIMFITIKEFLQFYYKQRLLIQDLEETKLELKEKNKEIEELEQEILNYSKKSHSIAFKQKSLEHKLKELTYNNEIATELDIKDKVEKLGKEIIGTKVEIELKKTGIEEIDDMLKYMQSECIKNDIQLDLQINGNIHQMVNNYAPKEKLQILIADHIKNAIIAIQHSKNIYKNILVRIGKIDGYFSLYIYDTGIEFENDTLEKLGKEPSTTHKEDGGTGMGFMNTFDTLKECKASLIIKEIGQPSDNNFTKVLIIKFDNKNDFKIISYRKK